MVINAHDSSKIPRLLLTREDGSLISDGPDNNYYYKLISDDTSGTTGTIWDPAAGKQIHLRALWASVTGAGTLEIYENVTGTTIFIMDFEGKKGDGIPFRGGILLTADNILGAKWTTDSGTETAHITAVGHED